MELSFLDILFEYRALSLPGLGRFVLDEVSAQLDEDGNLIYPPYYQIRFLQTSDSDEKSAEEIVHYLHYKFGIPVDQAASIAKEQVDRINTKIEETSIVQLPGLGRIFKAGNVRIHFIPDDIELLKEERKGFPVCELPVISQDSIQVPSMVVATIELPVEEHSPVEEVQIIKGESAISADIVQESDEIADELLVGNQPVRRKTLWWSLPLSLIVLTLGTIWGISSFRQKNTQIYKVHTTSSVEDRINIEPLEKELLYPEDSFENIEGTVYEQIFTEKQQEVSAGSEDRSMDSEKTEDARPVINSDLIITPMSSLNPSIGENDCFIIVGAFSQDNNISKMVAKLETYGQRVLIDKDIRLTRVGVLIPCDDPQLSEVYNALKSDVNKDAWIMKKK